MLKSVSKDICQWKGQMEIYRIIFRLTMVNRRDFAYHKYSDTTVPVYKLPELSLIIMNNGHGFLDSDR